MSSLSKATADLSIDAQLSSLALIGGSDANPSIINKAVDLRVEGGALIRKRLLVLGNICVKDTIIGTHQGNVITEKIQALDLTEGIQIVGNVNMNNDNFLCGNIISNEISPKDNETVTINGNVEFSGDVEFVGNVFGIETSQNIVAKSVESNTIVSNTITTDTLLVTSDSIFSGDVIIEGNLSAFGNTTLIDTSTLIVEDNKIVLNANAMISNVDSGICVERFQTENDVCDGDVIQDIPFEEGNVVTSTISTVTLNPDEIRVNNFYNEWFIKINSGLGANQVRKIIDFDGMSNVATINSDWSILPDATSDYGLFPGKFAGIIWEESENKWVFGKAPGDTQLNFESVELADVCVEGLYAESTFISGNAEVNNLIVNGNSVVSGNLMINGNLIDENGNIISGSGDLNGNVIGASFVQTDSIENTSGGNVCIDSDVTIKGNIEVTGMGLVSIGSIIPSMLTETQFQSLNGTGWILMDGRNVSGSVYESVTGFASVPDARGAVLRCKNNSRGDGFQNPAGDLALGTFENDQFQGHYHQNDVNANGGSEGFQSGGAIGNGFNLTTFATTVTTDGSNGTPRIGPETRVKNITINYFIRIN